jgi:hypothetical protein
MVSCRMVSLPYLVSGQCQGLSPVLGVTYQTRTRVWTLHVSRKSHSHEGLVSEVLV